MTQSGTKHALSCLGPAQQAQVLQTRSQTPYRNELASQRKRLESRSGKSGVKTLHGLCWKLTEFRCVDKPGLLLEGKKDQLTPAQVMYARKDSEWECKDHNGLLSVVKEVKPHVLIGTSTKSGAFTEEVVREMAKHVNRPVIFPLSNPTRLHEAKPQDLYDWTDGKVLVATGSPFDPVRHNGNEYEICQFYYSSNQILSLIYYS